MKRALIPMVMVILSATAAGAVEWESSCVNDTHLFREAIITDIITLNQTIYCRNNCSNTTLSCNPDMQDVDVDSAMVIIMTIIGVSAILVFISFNIKKSYTAMGLLYLILPLVFLVVAVSLSSSTIHAETQTAFQYTLSTISLALIAVLLVTLLVFLVKILKDALSPEGKGELKEL